MKPRTSTRNTNAFDRFNQALKHFQATMNTFIKEDDEDCLEVYAAAELLAKCPVTSFMQFKQKVDAFQDALAWGSIDERIAILYTAIQNSDIQVIEFVRASVFYLDENRNESAAVMALHDSIQADIDNFIESNRKFTREVLNPLNAAIEAYVSNDIKLFGV